MVYHYWNADYFAMSIDSIWYARTSDLVLFCYAQSHGHQGIFKRSWTNSGVERVVFRVVTGS